MIAPEFRETLNVFFSEDYEKKINDNMLEKNYVFPATEFNDYLQSLLKIPYSQYIEYIKNTYKEYKITSSDITQSSSFDACRFYTIEVLKEGENSGFTCETLGFKLRELMLSKGFKNTNTNNTKYGENQVKTAKDLGLTFEYYGYWYLTCIGFVFSDYSIEIQNQILARTILRNHFYQTLIINLIEKPTLISSYMSCLSQSTIDRRIGSVEKILTICANEGAIEGIIFNRISEPQRVSGPSRIMIIEKRQINWSFFEYGFNIYASERENLEKAIKRINDWKDNHDIYISYKNEKYKVRLDSNPEFKGVIQIRWRNNSPIAQKIKQVLKKGYRLFLVEAYTLKDGEKVVPIPDGINYSFSLQTTKEPRVFKLITYDK